MDSIYPKIESGRLMNSDDYEMKDNNIVINQKCFFIEVDIDIPKELTFIPISVKNKDNLACFVHGYIKNIVINHCDYEELIKFGIYVKKVH
jgi:hypothetical protein